MAQRIKHNLLSKYYKISTKLGVLHVHIDYDKENNIQRVFSQIAPLGSDTANSVALLGIMLSEYFKIGGKPAAMLKHLNSVKGQVIGKWEDIEILSLPHAIGLAIQAFLEDIAEKSADKHVIDKDRAK